MDLPRTVSEARPRQFQVVDLLVVVALWFPILALSVTSFSGNLKLGIIDASITVVGAFIVALWLPAGFQRIFGMFVATAVLWLSVSLVIVVIQPSRMTRCQSAPAASCKAYAEAQEIYRRTDYDGDGILEYAQALTGSNSLLEQTAGSGNLALVDRTFGNADMINGGAMPKAGYIFKILKAQGPHATGGAKSYVDQNGNMTQGYALVAAPAQYGEYARDTFIINNNGTIFQKDLGPNTVTLVLQMTEFNPDTTWVPSE